jgi:DNA-binding transcriptional regulator GbsR (MarR family)
LHYLGLIEKVPTQGSRKLLYRASSDSAARLLQAQAETTRKLAQISEAALKHAPKNKQLHAAQKLSTQLLRAFKNMREFKK